MSDLWAAIDLGSNSFHLLLSRNEAGYLVPVERIKERVRLLGGLDGGRLTDAAVARGLGCLARFAQRLQAVPPTQVIAMGTCALRTAANSEQFVAAAREVLGVPVTVISGEEEAHLIYAGVSRHVGPVAGERLVIDVGGGSTEFAAGSGLQPSQQASIDVGCVAYTDRFFPDTASQASGYLDAKSAALQELSRVDWVRRSFAQVVGTSGTFESVQTVLEANGWSNDGVTREGVARLEAAITDQRWLIQSGVPGLAPDRVDIFPAGVAIVSACMELLSVDSLSYVDASLQQGMLYQHLSSVLVDGVVVPAELSDVLGAVNDEIRLRTVMEMVNHFGVDVAQAARVLRTSLALFDQLADHALGLGHDDRELLIWAALLHEIGARVSARNYHRHGSYLLKHAEMRGFSRQQQGMLALMVRGHRRSFPALAFQAFAPEKAVVLMRLVALLRLAVILERSHCNDDSPVVVIEHADLPGASLQPADVRKSNERAFAVRLPDHWLDAHPLSARELAVEAPQLARAGLWVVWPG